MPIIYHAKPEISIALGLSNYANMLPLKKDLNKFADDLSSLKLVMAGKEIGEDLFNKNNLSQDLYCGLLESLFYELDLHKYLNTDIKINNNKFAHLALGEVQDFAKLNAKDKALWLLFFAFSDKDSFRSSELTIFNDSLKQAALEYINLNLEDKNNSSNSINILLSKESLELVKLGPDNIKQNYSQDLYLMQCGDNSPIYRDKNGNIKTLKEDNSDFVITLKPNGSAILHNKNEDLSKGEEVLPIVTNLVGVELSFVENSKTTMCDVVSVVYANNLRLKEDSLLRQTGSELLIKKDYEKLITILANFLSYWHVAQFYTEDVLGNFYDLIANFYVEHNLSADHLYLLTFIANLSLHERGLDGRLFNLCYQDLFNILYGRVNKITNAKTRAKKIAKLGVMGQVVAGIVLTIILAVFMGSSLIFSLVVGVVAALLGSVLTIAFAISSRRLDIDIKQIEKNLIKHNFLPKDVSFDWGLLTWQRSVMQTKKLGSLGQAVVSQGESIVSSQAAYNESRHDNEIRH